MIHYSKIVFSLMFTVGESLEYAMELLYRIKYSTNDVMSKQEHYHPALWVNSPSTKASWMYFPSKRKALVSLHPNGASAFLQSCSCLAVSHQQVHPPHFTCIFIFSYFWHSFVHLFSPLSTSKTFTCSLKQSHEFPVFSHSLLAATAPFPSTL